MDNKIFFIVTNKLCDTLSNNPTDEELRKKEFLANVFARLEVNNNANINAQSTQNNESNAS